MNLSEAISLFEERCESPIDVAALECIRAALAESTNSSHNRQSAPLDCSRHEWYQGECIHCRKQAVSH